MGVLLSDQLKRYDEAEAAFRKAIELDPAYSYPWNGLGNLLSDPLKRYDEAEAAYRKAIELDPADAYPWNGMGVLLTDRLKRYDEAEAAFRMAIQLDPAYAIAWRNLGRLLADHLQRDDEAEAAYGRALELEPEDWFTRIQLSKLSSRRMLARSVKAIEANDWAALYQTVSELITDSRFSQRWFVERSFVEDVVARALHDGNGPRMLASLRELGFERIAAPLLLALDAAIDGGAEKLASVEPEVRTAAHQLLERLQAAKAGEQCPSDADAGSREKESHGSRPRLGRP